ncbi:MAG: hypothetical protein IAE96_00695 [Chitinophagaceae bacterium]|nr:hypothetical protein [Chitinophagaceae bacterium]
MKKYILFVFCFISMSDVIFSQNGGGDYNPNTFCDPTGSSMCSTIGDLNQTLLNQEYQMGLFDIFDQVGDCILNEMGWDDWDHWTDYIENIVPSPWDTWEMVEDCTQLAWDMAASLDLQYVNGLMCNEANNDACYNSVGCEVDPSYDNSGEIGQWCN